VELPNNSGISMDVFFEKGSSYQQAPQQGQVSKLVVHTIFGSAKRVVVDFARILPNHFTESMELQIRG